MGGGMAKKLALRGIVLACRSGYEGILLWIGHEFLLVTFTTAATTLEAC
jgi:hypothetical protein